MMLIIMKPSTREKLINWANGNNWSASHPLDMERFWKFVIEAYTNGDSQISEDEFYGSLSSFYDDEDVLTDYYIKYENGIELLDCYNKEKDGFQ